MKYTMKVELEVEIDLFEKDYIDEDQQDEINGIVTETISNCAFEITENIFEEMDERTNVEINNAFTFNESVED